jgi:hypothetical protein
MKTFHLIPTRQNRTLLILTIILGLLSFKTQAQVRSGSAISDTVTYVLYNNDQNFDSKRTIVFNDKKSVDSLAHLLATKENKQYQIVYRKQGQQAKLISAKYLRTLDKTGFYSITIAYNKPGMAYDTKPVYIITSK